MHHDAAVDRDEESPTFGKPEIILFYNCSKGGVDNVDKYVSNYTVARTSNRWSMVIFYCLLNIGELNSFIVFKENSSTPRMRRRIFIRLLAKELCKEYMTSRVAIPSTPTNTKKRLRQILDMQDEPTRAASTDDITSGRCRICDWRKNRLSKTRCVACKQFICREHTAPVMCVNCTNSDDEVMDSE